MSAATLAPATETAGVPEIEARQLLEAGDVAPAVRAARTTLERAIAKLADAAGLWAAASPRVSARKISHALKVAGVYGEHDHRTVVDLHRDLSEVATGRPAGADTAAELFCRVLVVRARLAKLRRRVAS